ncbi:MAG: homoserine dehydrogenase [Erysipelotrichaceae bacterium]|nr:homoserine dehydrogenase [Erysipelotrichaceae bacterium]
MKIALLGHGTVGSGVTSILEDRKIDGIEIAKILTKRKRDSTDKRYTLDFDEILNDQSIDTVVECMGGLMPSYTYVKECLENGKHVISANKKLLARHPDLFETTERNAVFLLAEASTAGGIPWIKELGRISRNDEVFSISGIFNGTCNYILSKIFEEGMDFQEALAQAQEHGYAEADPRDDLCGYDTGYKLVISILYAFHKIVPYEKIPLRGIEHLSDRAVEYGKQNGRILKLIGSCSIREGKLQAYVLPCFVKKEDLFARVNENNNIVKLQSKFLGSLSFIGPGAGSLPTGQAIVEDLLDLKEGTAQNVKIDGCGEINDALEGVFYVVSKAKPLERYIAQRIDEESFLSIKCPLKTILKDLTEEDFIALMA